MVINPNSLLGQSGDQAPSFEAQGLTSSRKKDVSIKSISGGGGCHHGGSGGGGE